MGASAIEFRLRLAISTVVITLGYWAPWIEPMGWQRRSTLAGLALGLTRMGAAKFGASTAIVIVTGALIAALGAGLRVWGTAYLGTMTVNNAQMKAGTVLADGPYRYVRNPLYLGSWLVALAMAFAMPPTGALFALVLLAVLILRLILGEEAFLTGQLGEPYRAYLRAVPRLFPRLRSGLPRGGAKPNWGRAVLAELNPIGVFVALAFFSWSYDNWRIVQVILIGFGVSLVVRALLPRSPESPTAVA
ncbi:MAG TPA: isoprenylcysteine carboxylmethyltransferase family protein [Terracidiphilus sp.]|jgi:protein-S-isoprenylcysteine O-methyltransferase Ste14|nr:isoprenylcysteine carboxylmethyltransferase family protein [Terracidiphilus sp.]